jgi:aerobic-type carbon monoxide dehydrogenase small subunit (CoxS/CutS family)
MGSRLVSRKYFVVNVYLHFFTSQLFDFRKPSFVFRKGFHKFNLFFAPNPKITSKLISTIMANFTLNINGKQQQVDVDPATPMLWVLRDHLHLVGTKYGCGIAQCGACTIHLGDVAMRSCQLPVSQVGNQSVTTIEGLSEHGDHPVQKAWLEHDVAQCGYCQAGQIMNAAALLKANPRPNDGCSSVMMYDYSHICQLYSRIASIGQKNI